MATHTGIFLTDPERAEIMTMATAAAGDRQGLATGRTSESPAWANVKRRIADMAIAHGLPPDEYGVDIETGEITR